MSEVQVRDDEGVARLLVGRQRRFGRRRWQPQEGAQSFGEPIREGRAVQPVNRREGLSRRLLAVADALAAVAALSLVLGSVAGVALEPWTLAAAPIAVLMSKASGLYDRDDLVLNKTTLDEAPTLLHVTGLLTLIAFVGESFVADAAMTPAMAVQLWPALFFALFAGRVAARKVSQALVPPERCLVLGDADSLTTVTRKIEAAHLRTTVVAGIQLDALTRRLDAEAIGHLVETHDVHRLIVAPVTTDARETTALIRIAKALGVRVSVLPRLTEVIGSSVEFDHVEGLTMLGVRRFGLTRSSYALKRCFDVLGASVMLLATAPIFVAVALAVRLDSKGPVLFRQTRVGRDGERFEIFKFRTMVPEAEQLKSNLVHLNDTQGLFKILDDPRITRVGRILRRTALDELPQLINVWRGEMSLVGPRPLVVDEDAMIEGLDRSRLHLTPGMTGHWQIMASARVPLHEMVRIDYVYVANWSLWTDLKILLRTVPYMLARRGA